MAKKHRPHLPPRLTPADLRARADRAAREGRYQQALELAKQLCKELPTPENRQFLRTTYLGRARQLRGQGATRDAVTVLQVAMQLDGQEPAWLEQVAEELAACGEVRLALDALRRVPESPALPRVLQQAADVAVQRGSEAGRKLLSEEHHADFDRIMRAWTQLEAGQDEPVREALQGIGLRSPFAEWKLLVRGLLAYYGNDDARALENWQRLDSNRLPARLAAPFRFLIDPNYRVAQQPAAQAALQKQADQLRGLGLLQPLRSIQAALARDDALDLAFRQAGTILPALRAEAPALVPRLASCFYWSVIMTGGPDCMPRLQRLFGSPPDDPHLHRLEAIAYDKSHDFAGAHDYWQRFENDLKANPAGWTAEEVTHARALLWCHMGHNAASIPNAAQMAMLPAFLRDHPDRPQPLKPSAEECFRRALELAPDLLEAHESLFRHHQTADHKDKAIKAGRALLAQFPDHLPTLLGLGDLLLHEGNYAQGLELFHRAFKANPLDPALRGRLGTAHLLQARAHAEAGRFEEARAEYRTTRTLLDNRASVLCKWAACEFKAGDSARAEELLQEALAEAGSRLALAHSMLIEVIRLKLPRTLKQRFDREFKEALAEPPTAVSAAAVADTVAAHHLGGITYHGQKTHDKKVMAYLDRACGVAFTEDQLEKVCVSLLRTKGWRLLRTYCHLGENRFPRSPQFPFFLAESYLALGPARCPGWRVWPLLEEVQRLAEAQPADERNRSLLEEVRKRRELLGVLNPFGGMFRTAFESVFGDDDDWDDDDDD